MFLLAFVIENEANTSCQQTEALIKTLHRIHLKPPALSPDDELYLVDQLIHYLDEDHMLFLQSDLEKLKSFAGGILDTNSGDACVFVDALFQTYTKRSGFADSIIINTLSNPIDFSAKGKISLSVAADDDYLADIRDLEERIRNNVKHWIIEDYVSMYMQRDSATGKELTNIDDLQDEIRKQALTVYRCNEEFDDDEDELRSFLVEAFFNQIALLYDPHTAYFSPIDKQKFQNRLSSEERSFGMLFTEDDDERIIIGDILPGGPAWLSGSVFENDILNRITNAAGGEVVITCLSGSEITEVVDLGKEDVLNFHLEHEDGSKEVVRLKKGVVDVSENVIHGMVLEGDLKIGYVALPSFYTDWNEDEVQGCANDLAKEILSLKREGIEGLILDLRYNGGGSMYEAIQIAGIFINEGTLLISEKKGDKPRLIKDPNRGTVYDDPLIVMVNGFSASASEMVSAILQDYNRALIVGSPTFGKSTSQQIIPLLASNGRSFTAGENGFVKVTSGAFYRINGESHQAIGVQPDILLTDPYAGLFNREADKSRVISLEKIEKKTYAYPLSPLPVDELKNKSQQRLEARDSFNKLDSLNGELMALDQVSALELSPAAFHDYSENWKEIFRSLSQNIYSNDSIYQVTQHRLGESLSQFDEFERMAVEEQFIEVKQDIYIKESYLILSDWISGLKN